MSTEDSPTAEVVVIGAGPGGYAAAFHAADLGLRVTLVDADPNLGGVCLNRGCIPSKALLHVAKLLDEAEDAEEWGISFARPKIDLDRLRAWKGEVVSKLSGGIAELAKHRGVTVKNARARFVDSETLDLEKPDGSHERLRFGSAILATGSSPAMPGIFAIGDERVMDSTGALELPSVPQRLLVVGGGYIGLEMGTVYAALGSSVTCVELTDGLLPGADRDLVRPVAKRLEKTFEAVHLETKVESLRATDRGILATLSGEGAPSELLFDRVLVSVGRRPNTRDLGLENTRVRVLPAGFVKVDRTMRTDDSRIWAIGDVAGEPMLAHKASREGKVAADAIAGKKAEFDNIAIPAVVFTDPEVAWCGILENRARAEGVEHAVARFPWAVASRAVTIGRPDGLTKIVFDPKTERVLGVGIVGAGAGELIAEGVLAVEMAAVAHDLADSIHAHPTLSETMGETADVFLGSAVHLYRPRRGEREKAARG